MSKTELLSALIDFQNEVYVWRSRQPWDQLNPTHPLLGVVEEVGELAHAHLKREQGIRGTPEEHDAAKVDAIGDILVYLADYCERNGISLGFALIDTWEKVRKRDWSKNKETGE